MMVRSDGCDVEMVRFIRVGGGERSKDKLKTDCN